MALFGYLKDLENQLTSLGFSTEVLDYLINQRLPFTQSRLELEKDITAISSVYEPKPRFKISYVWHS